MPLFVPKYIEPTTGRPPGSAGSLQWILQFLVWAACFVCCCDCLHTSVGRVAVAGRRGGAGTPAPLPSLASLPSSPHPPLLNSSVPAPPAPLHNPPPPEGGRAGGGGGAKPPHWPTGRGVSGIGRVSHVSVGGLFFSTIIVGKVVELRENGKNGTAKSRSYIFHPHPLMIVRFPPFPPLFLFLQTPNCWFGGFVSSVAVRADAWARPHSTNQHHQRGGGGAFWVHSCTACAK